MRIHELIPHDGVDLLIYHEAVGTRVLTPFGAVYTSEDTDDRQNMSPAIGILFTSDKWRWATPQEIANFRSHDVYRPKQQKPKPPTVVQLTLVKKE